MSGWLGLTQQGLSPCKKRQAYLGAANVPIDRARVESDSLRETAPVATTDCALRSNRWLDALNETAPLRHRDISQVNLST